MAYINTKARSRERKIKTTINLDISVYNQAKDTLNKFGCKDMSTLINFVLKEYCYNPKKLAVAMRQEHIQKVRFYTELIESIEYLEQEKEEVSLLNPLPEEKNRAVDGYMPG